MQKFDAIGMCHDEALFVEVDRPEVLGARRSDKPILVKLHSVQFPRIAPKSAQALGFYVMLLVACKCGR